MTTPVDFRFLNQGFDTKAALLAALTGVGNAGKAGFAIEGGIITFAANLAGEVRSFSDVSAILVSLQNQINALQVGSQAQNFLAWIPGDPYVQGDIRAQTSGGYFVVWACYENDPGDPGDETPNEAYWTQVSVNDAAVGKTLEWLNKTKANA